MDRSALAQRLEECTYVVEAFEFDERFSQGSAFAINETGTLLTAAHVVTSRLPVRESDVKHPSLRWQARKKGGAWVEYRPGICGPAIKIDFFRQPMTLDLAVLHPVQPISNCAHLEITMNSPVLGDQVLMAGYPDEMELPFSFDRFIDFHHPIFQSQGDQVRKMMTTSKQLLMIKSGMIGYKAGFDWKDSQRRRVLEGDILYIDNVMHSGASGGPVINSEGLVIGVLTQRAVTEISTWEEAEKEGEADKLRNFNIPSGSAVAVSARSMLPFL